MKLIVFGATGDVGSRVVTEARADPKMASSGSTPYLYRMATHGRWAVACTACTAV